MPFSVLGLIIEDPPGKHLKPGYTYRYVRRIEVRSIRSRSTPSGIPGDPSIAPRVSRIYSIIFAESYSESAITAPGDRPRSSFMDPSWPNITCVPFTLAGWVTSTRGSSESQSFMIWFLYPSRTQALLYLT